MTSCPSLTHSCLSLDAELSEKNKRDKTITSYLHNKTCIETLECDETTLCQRLKNDLWKKKEDIFVRDCKAKCSLHSETSTPPINSTRASYNMTSSPEPSTQSPPPKCLACERESLSTLCKNRPRRINCESSGFDSCFTLKAELINATSGELIEKGQWQDCAIQSRDCEARGRCMQLKTWLKLRGYDWKVCNVECCRGDYCNDFIPTPVAGSDVEDVGSGVEALYLDKASIIFTGFISVFLVSL